MTSALTWIGRILLWGISLYFLVLAVRSRIIGFKRAAAVSLAIALLSMVPTLFNSAAYLFGLAGLAFSAAVLFIPVRKLKQTGRETGKRIDERDIQFSRCRLQKGTKEFTDYYSRHPEREKRDEATRALPGLLSPKSKHYNKLNAAITSSSFNVISALHSVVSGSTSCYPPDIPKADVLEFLTKWLDHCGFKCVGTAKLKPEHYYSNHGRKGENYGAEVAVEHQYAIVIGSRMSNRFIGTAPESAEVTEVAHRYLDSGVAAVEAAQFLRNLGYSARAHIDGSYHVIPALIADDAGMGGFGWSNLFITDKYGPAVRLAVVTTEMELPEGRKESTDYLSFCVHCRKCARHCPSRAISRDEIAPADGDKCFAFWNAAGTDCGICMAVCPMNHPWGFLRKLAVRSWIMAKLLPLLDDLVFGRTQKPLTSPEWMRPGFNNSEEGKRV